jgi:hypothetical protein
MFDIKKFLTENKLTSASKIDEAKNPFDLYADMPGVDQATTAIQAALDRAAAAVKTGKISPQRSWSKMITPVLSRYEKFGAEDTTSEETIIRRYERLIGKKNSITRLWL